MSRSGGPRDRGGARVRHPHVDSEGGRGRDPAAEMGHVAKI